jgi:hypothetical protein
MERGRTWALSVEAWHQLAALLLESFEVTLDRGDIGDRVSPELLGRVFEGMMEPADRKDAGTFYTPAELVPAIVRETMVCHLAYRLGRDESSVARAWDDPDPELESARLALRILDPAVGSGAFLVGALALLCPGEQADAVRVRHVITRRLFGVDRNPVAVRLTELRLWLELLRAMRGRVASRVTPLPNLDTSIRAGDALLDPFAGHRVDPSFARRLARARRSAAMSHGAERRAAVRTLRDVELRAAARVLTNRALLLRESIADLRDQAASPDLFGNTPQPTAAVHRHVTTLRAELRDVRRQRAALRTDGAAPVFGVESAFAPVLDAGGFDLVIGNPPWVRGERLPARQRRALAGRYRWWRGAGPGWRHTPDLSIAFIERSHELLAPGGTVGLLLPGKVATTSYAARCRAALAEHATLHLVADLTNDPRAVFDATTYPLALVASRRRAMRGHRVALDLDHECWVAQQDWRDATSWSRADPVLQTLARRLRDLPSLQDRHPPALGIKTGANDVYLDPPQALHAYTRPAIRGRDVRAFDAPPSSRLLWPADARGNPWPTLPRAVAAHLAPHRTRLEQRSDLVAGRWWQVFRVATATSRWRVTWPDLARSLRAAPLRAFEPVPLNSCYVIAVPRQHTMLACAAWLNATIIGALARAIAEPAANGFARYGARAVGSIPVPVAVDDDQQLAALGESTWSDDVQAAIDERVARLLHLDDREREWVDALRTHRR